MKRVFALAALPVLSTAMRYEIAEVLDPQSNAVAA